MIRALPARRCGLTFAYSCVAALLVASTPADHAAARDAVRFYADAFRQPDGRALRLQLANADPERSTPALRRFVVLRPHGAEIRSGTAGLRLGTFLFGVGDTAPRNRRRLVLTLTRPWPRSQIVGRGAGARVRWDPDGSRLLVIDLPESAINPTVNLTGQGARLVRLQACRPLRLAARWLEADRSPHRHTAQISARRLRRAGFCGM